VLAAAMRKRRMDSRNRENGCTEQHPPPLFDSARGRTLPVQILHRKCVSRDLENLDPIHAHSSRRQPANCRRACATGSPRPVPQCIENGRLKSAIRNIATATSAANRLI
jgi:hypothetical protein